MSSNLPPPFSVNPDLCTTVASAPKTRSTERRNRSLLDVNEDSEYRRILVPLPYLGRVVGCAEVSKVYLVGAGPGNPELLTLRAARLLAHCDVVLHDALVPQAILDLALSAKLIPVGKRAGKASTAQEFINRELIYWAQLVACVVRLKSGDPGIFGRTDEELSALSAAGIAVEIVPGISAAHAAAASLGVSLTRRGVARSVTFLTPASGPDTPESDWPASLLASETAAVYMAGKRIPELAQTLLAAGRAWHTPVAVIENVSYPDERIWRLTLGEARLGLIGQHQGPVMVLIGEILNTEVVPPHQVTFCPSSDFGQITALCRGLSNEV